MSAVASTPMLRLRRPRIAWGAGGFTFVLILAAIPLSSVAHELTGGWLVQPLLMIPFAGVGAVVAARQPRNPIGWLLLAVALASTAGADAGFYAVRAYRVDHHGLPLSRLAVFLTQGWVAMLLLLPLPIALFPDGRLPQRWRWSLAVYALAVLILLGALAYDDSAAFTDRRIVVDSSGELKSLGGSPSGASGVAWTILIVVYAVLALTWVVRQVVSYRRATGDRRAQLKWLLSGGVVSVVGMVLTVAFGSSHDTALLIISRTGFVGLVALPISIGIGILKYRLYEIDRLISRTLSYALLTGLLVGVFAGLVLLTTRVLPFSSPVGVAASTLVAAGLFAPLRVRLQRLVDRRFNRARYDAEATVAAFATRLRDAVDIDTVLTELTATTTHSLEPTHVTVWVRGRN